MSAAIKIVVLDRGWVFVGRVTTMAGEVKIEQAQCIRRWGTTRGLGELRNGPTAHTQCDPAGTVTVPGRAVICMLDVEGDAWTHEIAS
jgi:hypothetical protein